MKIKDLQKILEIKNPEMDLKLFTNIKYSNEILGEIVSIECELQLKDSYSNNNTLNIIMDGEVIEE